MKRLLVGLIGIALSFGAVASDWRFVAASDKTEYLLDVESIAESNIPETSSNSKNQIGAFIKINYLEGNKFRSEGVYHSIEKLIINCDRKEFYRQLYVDFDIKDDVINYWRSKRSILLRSDFHPIVPDTLSESVIKAACNYYKTRDILGIRPPLIHNWKEFIREQSEISK